MKAKILTLVGMLTLLALTVVPVLAPSPTVTASSNSVVLSRSALVNNHAAVTPTINIAPLAITSSQAMGTIMTQTLVISNIGSGDLIWQINESAVARLAQPGAPAATEIVQNGGFEDGHQDWEEYSANFGTVLNIGAGPRTGNWWAWFGGAGNGVAEEAYISQTISSTPGLATLAFWMRMDGRGSGNFTVTLDSTVIFTANQAMTATYTAYTLVTRDVSAFADGQAHVLKLAESDPDTSGNFTVDIDDVSLTVIDCVPSNLPWLTVSPMAGTTGANNSSEIDLIFNSTGRAGLYPGTLCITSNDPAAEIIKVPATLKSLGVFLPLIRR